VPASARARAVEWTARRWVVVSWVRTVRFRDGGIHVEHALERKPKARFGLLDPSHHEPGSGWLGVHHQDLHPIRAELPDEVRGAEALARLLRELRKRIALSTLLGPACPPRQDQQAEPARSAVGEAALALEKAIELAG
jgi:hypothetical protein